MALSEDQENVLAQKRLPERPFYYDSTQQQGVVIPEDLETFLLLSEPDLREELNDRLSASNEGANPDRDTLYAEALSFEEADAIIILVDYETQLAGYSQFRDRVLTSPSGASPGTGPILQDTQRSFGALLEERERTYHRLQVSRVLRTLRDRQEGSEEELKQRASWADVIAVYR